MIFILILLIMNLIIYNNYYVKIIIDCHKYLC